VRLIRAQHSVLATPSSVVNARLLNEVHTLQEALNAFVLHVSFECDIETASTLIEDAVAAEAPTSMELIQKSAETNCCRISGATPKQVRATTPRREPRTDRQSKPKGR